MHEHRNRAGWPRRKPVQIERKPFAQQFQPYRRIRRWHGITTRLRRCLRVRTSIQRWINANGDRLLLRHKCPDCTAIGPIALGKQQMQLCGTGMLRL